MNIHKNRSNFKQSIVDSILFWLAWLLILVIIIGTFERISIDSVSIVLLLLTPHILPVYFIGLLFDEFYFKKKITLFFILAIPFAYFAGRLINSWSAFVLEKLNVSVNHEFLIFVFSIMYIGFRYTKLAIAQKSILKEEENKRTVAELQYLRAQLNPHFLFNALNSIYSLILSKSDKAGDAVLTLSELMRYHIDLSGKQEIPLANEIALIERYIELQKLKLAHRCDIKFLILGEVKNSIIAPLILMPFVENAFKHGITSIPDANFVHIQISIEKMQLVLEIKNSVAQITEIEKNNSDKIGISNTLKRLDLCYFGNYTFSSQQKDNVYTILLTINM